MSSQAPPDGNKVYTLDNDHDAAKRHHAALADLLDPQTRRRILNLRPSWTGGHCLEVGAGHGSIATWLADQVGSNGRVVAADLKPSHIPEHPQLEAVAHDLNSDGAWSDALAGRFDLIHARLTLIHLPKRDSILTDLTTLLRPGGAILIEDWVPTREQIVVSAPTPQAEELYQAYQRAAAAVFDTAGNDPKWGRRMHAALIRAGMANVRTEIHGQYWEGGSPGCRLVAAAAAQMRPKLLDAGMTDSQLDEFDLLLYDPDLVLHGHLMYSCSGRM